MAYRHGMGVRLAHGAGLFHFHPAQREHAAAFITPIICLPRRPRRHQILRHAVGLIIINHHHTSSIIIIHHNHHHTRNVSIFQQD